MKKTQGKIEKNILYVQVRQVYKMEKKSYIVNANKLVLPHLYSDRNIHINVHEPKKVVYYNPNIPPRSPKSPVTDNKVNFEVDYKSPTEPQISKVYTKSLHNYNNFVNKNNQHLENLNIV